MVRAGLEDHFGNISLSLEDLDEIAQDIVGKKSLTKISVMLESIGDTEESIGNMKESLSAIDKISWKINAGFEIDKNDKESYLSAAEDYMKYAQETLDNQGYTVSVATDLLLGKGSTIGAENDAFYSGLDAELGRLQKKLQKKIKKAVKNGVDIDTDESIQTLLQKMSDITSAVTEAENEAKLQPIDLKYSGKDLTAADFEQLSKDIQEYEKQVVDGAGEAYESAMTTLNARLKTGDISKEKYNKESEQYKQGYYNTQAQAMSNSSEYLMDSIQDAYSISDSEMESFRANMASNLREQLKKGVSASGINDVLDDVVDEAVSGVGISSDVQAQITELFQSGLGSIWTDMEDLEVQLKKGGMQVPQSLADGITDLQSLSAVTGSADDAMLLLADSIGNSNEMSTVVSACEGAGASVPESIAEAINNNSPQVTQAANSLIAKMRDSLEGQFSVKITLDMAAAGLPAGYAAEKNPGKTDKKDSLPSLPDLINKVKSNAEGGIYYSPILTTFAEEGPEAAIPLDGSARAKLLWQQAGQILGMGTEKDKALYSAVSGVSVSPGRDKEMYQNLLNATSGPAGSSAGTSDVKINYAPVIKVEGNADEQTLTKVIKLSQAEFAEMMENYLFSKGRVSFS